MSELKIEELRERWIRTRLTPDLLAWSEAVGRAAQQLHEEFLKLHKTLGCPTQTKSELP